MSIKRNSLYNVTGAVLPIALTLVTVPLYLTVIGAERYAILSIAWTLVGYFGFIDLGLSRATAQRIATLAHADPGERTAVFWTAAAVNAGFGLLGGLLLVGPAYVFFSEYFRVSEPLRHEITAAVPWLAVAVPIGTLSGVLSGALQGRERFLELNLIRILGALLTQVLPLAVAWVYDIHAAWLVAAVIAGRVTTFGFLLAQCKKHVPLVGPPRGRRELIAPLFKFGGWVTVTAVVGPLMVTLDRFLIGALVNAQAVTYYVVPYNLAWRVTVVPGALSDALFPRYASTNEADGHLLTSQAVGAILAIVTPLIACGVIIMAPFLTWWLGSGFAAEAAVVGQIIALGLWANSLAHIPFAKLQGQGRPDIVALCHLAELLPYLGAVALALHYWGIEGAALAWSLRVIADMALLFWFSNTRIGVMRLAVPVLFLGASMAIASFVSFDQMLYWLASGLLLAVVVCWSWLVSPQVLKAAVMRIVPGVPRAPEASR